MPFPRSSERVPRLIELPHAESTNDELAARAAGAPQFTTVVTLDQRAGRGRMGRVWVTPPGKALAASVLLTTDAPASSFGWVPLIAGLAMTRAVHRIGVASARLKWPNDVLTGARKVSGMLSELREDGTIIVGAGLNLAQRDDELPVPTATSLAMEGVEADAADLADRALDAFLDELQLSWSSFTDWKGDVEASGIRAAVQAQCSTLGEVVRVTLPSGDVVIGTATHLDTLGQLVVQRADGGELIVSAGDITHVRHTL